MLGRNFLALQVRGISGWHAVACEARGGGARPRRVRFGRCMCRGAWSSARGCQGVDDHETANASVDRGVNGGGRRLVFFLEEVRCFVANVASAGRRGQVCVLERSRSTAFCSQASPAWIAGGGSGAAPVGAAFRFMACCFM